MTATSTCSHEWVAKERGANWVHYRCKICAEPRDELIQTDIFAASRVKETANAMLADWQKLSPSP